MTTECIASKLEFQGLEGRRVEAEFNGGQITSDAGGLLLREVESRYGFIRGLAACFGDRRDPRFTEFSVEELVGQRIYGLALGYEDLNDHEELRADPLMAVLVGKEDDAWPSSTTTNAEIVHNPHLPCGWRRDGPMALSLLLHYGKAWRSSSFRALDTVALATNVTVIMKCGTTSPPSSCQGREMPFPEESDRGLRTYSG